MSIHKRALPVALAALLFFAGWSSGAGAGAGADQPVRVVVSVQPLHSLAAAVMKGLGEPALLVRGANSPHDYSLTPADARALAQAQLVVWVGEAMETVLIRPISALATEAEVMEAMDLPGVEVLAGRDGGMWEAHDDAGHGDGPDPHAHAHAHDHDHDHEGLDGHIWLDPRNAAAIARAVAESLAKLDPANAEGYRSNAADLSADLETLEREIAGQLAPVRAAPFIVFHDAYQYFEKRFGLNAAGSITISPERAPGAKRIAEIRQRLRQSGAVCVFVEPQYEPALARTVVEGTEAKIATLDPLGAELTPGPAAYGAMLRRLASSLRGCLLAGS